MCGVGTNISVFSVSVIITSSFLSLDVYTLEFDFYLGPEYSFPSEIHLCGHTRFLLLSGLHIMFYIFYFRRNSAHELKCPNRSGWANTIAVRSSQRTLERLIDLCRWIRRISPGERSHFLGFLAIGFWVSWTAAGIWFRLDML